MALDCVIRNQQDRLIFNGEETPLTGRMSFLEAVRALLPSFPTALNELEESLRPWEKDSHFGILPSDNLSSADSRLTVLDGASTSAKPTLVQAQRCVR